MGRASRLLPVMLVLALAQDAGTQCEVELFHSPNAPIPAGGNDYFGKAIETDGDRVIVGASDQWGTFFPGISIPGAAHLFERGPAGWELVQTLSPSDGDPTDLFGSAVALSGRLAAVGARGHDGKAGAVYVFRRGRSGWVEVAKLQPLDSTPGQWFGSSVAIGDQGTLVVGAMWDDEGANDAGAAYVFTPAAGGWTQAQKLFASTPLSNDQLGVSCDVDGDRIVVCSRGKPFIRPGRAHVFEKRGTWIPTAVLDPAQNLLTSVGEDVDLDGDLLLLSGDDTGIANLYEYDGASWNRTVLLPSVPPASARTAAVALAGDRAAVGMTDIFGPGQAFLFERDRLGWGAAVPLLPATQVLGERFGAALAFGPGEILVGAPRGNFFGGTPFEPGFVHVLALDRSCGP